MKYYYIIFGIVITARETAVVGRDTSYCEFRRSNVIAVVEPHRNPSPGTRTRESRDYRVSTENATSAPSARDFNAV